MKLLELTVVSLYVSKEFCCFLVCSTLRRCINKRYSWVVPQATWQAEQFETESAVWQVKNAPWTGDLIFMPSKTIETQNPEPQHQRHQNVVADSRFFLGFNVRFQG